MKILIADDHDLLRDVLRSYLEAEGGFDLHFVSDANAAIDLMKAEGPFDVTLLDFTMPGMDGFRGLERAIGASGGRPVALMSGTAPRTAAEQAISMGAAGFLPKTLAAKSLVNAIRFMASGEKYLPVGFMAPGPDQPASPLAAMLSPRERQVLGGLCRGLSNKEIARELTLREPTIKLHVKLVCRKLEARNRTHAAMLAKESGFC